MVVSQAINNFAGGELSKSMAGRFDLPIYASGLQLGVNWLTDLPGGARFAPGSIYTAHTKDNKVCVFIPFRYSDDLSYGLLFTDQKMRVVKNFGVVLETAKVITGATKANPCVVTSAGHGFVTGDEVYVDSVTGMFELNGGFYTVGATAANTVALKDIDGTDVDSSAYTTYASGGTIARVYEITSPYAEADLYQLSVAQRIDIMYIAHPTYAPYKLTRAGDASWTLATYSRTSDPFTGANKYPGAVAFYGGRLFFGGSNDDPDTIWGSRAPTAAGLRRYDDFTTGSDALDAVIYPISPATNMAEKIRWLAGTSKFLGIGGYGAIYRADGGTSSAAITASAIRVVPLNYDGVEAIRPVYIGDTIFYVRRGGRVIDSFAFSVLTDDYQSKDQNLANDEITTGGIIQIAESRGRPDRLWAVRSDGVLLALTTKTSEEISSWTVRKIGGSGKVLSVVSIPQAKDFDVIWLIVERVIDGKTRRYIEYIKDEAPLPERTDTYTEDEDVDDEVFANLTYEAQRRLVRLDSALVLTGATSFDLTLSAVSGTNVLAVSSTAAFAATDVGRRFTMKYTTGLEAGVAQISSYINATQVRCNVRETFSTTALTAGSAYFTFDTVSKINHLEGEDVVCLADGKVVDDLTVTDGSITLPEQTSVAIVGEKYRGILCPMDLELGGMNGPAQIKTKLAVEVGLKVRNTSGIQVGTQLYDMLSEPKLFNTEADATDRPAMPQTGEFKVSVTDESSRVKKIYVVQNQPLPANVLSIVPYIDVSNE